MTTNPKGRGGPDRGQGRHPKPPGEKYQQISLKLPPDLLEWLNANVDNRNGFIVDAIKSHKQLTENRKMKTINLGKKNDLTIMAVKADNRFYPLSNQDLEFETPDVKINYDSGVYPGVTLDELPQYICDKAANQ